MPSLVAHQQLMQHCHHTPRRRCRRPCCGFLSVAHHHHDRLIKLKAVFLSISFTIIDLAITAVDCWVYPDAVA